MKITALFVMACLASSAMAGEVISPVPTKSKLVVTKPFDRMDRSNVGVSMSTTGRSISPAAGSSKAIDVSITGNALGTVTVELLYVKEAIPGTSNAGEQRVLVAGQATTNEVADKLSFEIAASNGAAKIKGWFVRVVEEGRIVGVAGSSEKFAAMAADPATAVRYGEK
jgi:hypothetical protein